MFDVLSPLMLTLAVAVGKFVNALFFLIVQISEIVIGCGISFICNDWKGFDSPSF